MPGWLTLWSWRRRRRITVIRLVESDVPHCVRVLSQETERSGRSNISQYWHLILELTIKQERLKRLVAYRPLEAISHLDVSSDAEDKFSSWEKDAAFDWSNQQKRDCRLVIAKIIANYFVCAKFHNFYYWSPPSILQLAFSFSFSFSQGSEKKLITEETIWKWGLMINNWLVPTSDSDEVYLC